MTNGDRIRTFTDENLALTIMCPNEAGLADIPCDKNNQTNCLKCCFDWLQAEEDEL